LLINTGLYIKKCIGTSDLDIENTWVRFLEKPFELPVSPDLLGLKKRGLK